MKIGILQTGHAPEQLLETHGDYAAHFERLLAGNGFSFETYNVVDMEFPQSPNNCDGWLITGSKHGAYEDIPFIAPLEDFIRAVDAADVPMVGICFGHQLIAQALGGKVEKFKGGWAVGHSNYDWGGETVSLNAWHQDQVVALPDGATVLASNDFCKNAAMVYGNRIFTVQAHPEYGGESIDIIARFRGKGVIPDPQLETVSANLDKPLDNALLGQKIARFFKERSVA